MSGAKILAFQVERGCGLDGLRRLFQTGIKYDSIQDTVKHPDGLDDLECTRPFVLIR